MKSELEWLSEPQLSFGHKQRALDPRDGLALFGPFATHSSGAIRVVTVGPAEALDDYRRFVRSMQKPIMSATVGRPPFPGFQAVFGCTWPVEPVHHVTISNQIISQHLRESNSSLRSFRLAEAYIGGIQDFVRSNESGFDVFIIIVTRMMWKMCRPLSPTRRIEPTVLQRVAEKRTGQAMLFADELDGRAAEFANSTLYDIDFHDQLKARLLSSGLLFPTQLMVDSTLRFCEKQRGLPLPESMLAHLAWTQSSTLYYKAGYTPWKLDGVRPGVCYVGLVFKRMLADRSNFACSAAQMFLDSGDGVIFRGNNGPWLASESQEYHLDESSAASLLEKAITAYQREHGDFPKEMFIHGRANFSDTEWRGFESVCKSRNISLVGITIKRTRKLKLYRDVTDQKSRYGVLRGLALMLDDTEAYLFTQGFVPRLNTSTSLEIPNPLRITIARGRADLSTVLTDVMALTKLNYNACIFADGLPVTLRFSDRVGSILVAAPNMPQPVLPFKFYI